MPWCYTIWMEEPRDAIAIRDDWEAIGPETFPTHGGVTVHQDYAVVVSQSRNPDYEEMRDLGYVIWIDEERNFPERGQSGLNPPIPLGYGINLIQ